MRKLAPLFAIASVLSAPATAAAPTEPFLWGVANAAFQTEAEPMPSDWTAWAKEPGRIEGGAKPEQVFGFWKNYEKEFDLARDLGANAFRMSIAWERIEPTAGKYDDAALAHYEEMIVAMRKRGLDPVITLHHFVNPAWLKDGIANPEFPERFAKFAEHVVARLGAAPAKVRWWITLNEPEVLAKSGYLDGDWPPGMRDLQATCEAMAQLVRAHVRAVNALRKLPGASEWRFGIAKHWRPFEAKSISPLDWIATKLTDNFFNRQMMEGVLTGKIRMWAPGAKKVKEDLAIEGGRLGLDFVGMNYYGRSVVRFTTRSPFVVVSEGDGPKSDIGWEMHAEGMYDSLRQVAEYGLPILVTENGVADANDAFRAGFIRDHVAQIDRARAEGIPVTGYLHWTLTDNLEWSKGLVPKFGLCAYSLTEKAHACRPSFQEYRKIIQAHRH